MIVFRGADIVDGTGVPPVQADVVVDGDRISVVGSAGTVPDGAREVDAAGLVLCPGFVDTHTHDDVALLRYPGLPFKAAQGVTSVVVGNCGFSAAPAAQSALRLFEGIFGTGDDAPDWDDQAGYMAAVAARAPAVNSVALVGHSTLRLAAMGTERREPTSDELARMRSWLRRAMEQGACGLSTGLIYNPGRFAKTDEIAALCEEIAPFGGVYATHMRNEGNRLLDSIEETLSIGEAAGCAVHVSHHKAAGRPAWGLVADSLRRCDAARAEGREVTLDVYPYTAASSRLAAYHEIGAVNDGSAASVTVASCPTHRQYEGWTIEAIAQDMGTDARSATDRLVAGEGRHSVAILEAMCEDDIETNLRHPHVMVGSDGIPVLEGKPHPRLFGTFPRVLARYVRERQVVSLPEAVRKMTSAPCARFGLTGRGVIREGAFADLVLFEAAAVADRATYTDPMQEPGGIAMVVVNGQVVVENGRHTGAPAGRVLAYRALG